MNIDKETVEFEKLVKQGIWCEKLNINLTRTEGTYAYKYDMANAMFELFKLTKQAILSECVGSGEAVGEVIESNAGVPSRPDLIGKLYPKYNYLDKRLLVGTKLFTHPQQSDLQAKLDEKEKLTVWTGEMPESNGKTNYTAILMRKGGELHEGFTIARSEYPDRVRYEADCIRWLIGELEAQPFILDYDSDKRSDYVPPTNDLQANNDRLLEALNKVYNISEEFAAIGQLASIRKICKQALSTIEGK